MAINQDILDGLLVTAIRNERGTNRLARRIDRDLRRLDRQVLAEIARLYPRGVDRPPLNRRRLRARINAIRQTMLAFSGENIRPAVREFATSLYSDTVDATITAMEESGLDRIGVQRPRDVDFINTDAGRAVRRMVFEHRLNSVRRTVRAVTDAVTSGATLPELRREVRAAQKISRNGAATMMRTVENLTANAARLQVYQANGNLIDSLQWSSVLDARTSSICRHRHGRVRPVRRNQPNWRPPSGSLVLDPLYARPPAHPNCRAVLTVVVKQWQALPGGDDLPADTRALFDGRVPVDEDYFAWAARQGNLSDVLGRTRARLHRRGGLPIERMTAGARPVPLETLRRRYPAAFKAAGL